MRMKVVTLIALLAGITLLVLGITQNQYLNISEFFSSMNAISAIYPAP